MKSLFKKHSGFLIITSLFFLLGLLRLNDLSLYTDCTRYLIWGNSIAHGQGFVDNTQPEPEYYIVNAPFFSVLLAPVLLFFPLSLTAAKVWALLWGVLSLLLIYQWLRNQVGQTPALAATLFFALNPLTVVLSTEVLSETSFLCALLGIFILLERMDQTDPSRWTAAALILILSLIMLLREVGIALLTAAVLFLFIRRRWRLALLSGGSAVLIFALWTYRNLGIVGAPESSQSPNLEFFFQHFVTSPDTTLFHELAQRILINFNSYAGGLGGMLLYRFPLNLISQPSGIFQATTSFLNLLQPYVFILFLPLWIYCIKVDFSRSKTALFRLFFIIAYLCILLLYPVQDVRFLFPLLPFALFYILLTITAISDSLQLSLPIRRILAGTIILLAVFPNVLCLYEVIGTNVSYRSDPIEFSRKQTAVSPQSSYFSTPWKILGEWIDREIPQGSIIASPDKGIVPFAPNHKFLELNRAVPLPLFESLLRNNAAGYLLAPVVAEGLTEYQSMINESNRFRFELIARISRLNLYRIHSRLEDSQRDSASSAITLNLESSDDLFSFARFALKNERYIEALAVFNKLQARLPHVTEIMYQRLLAYTFLLDSANAVQYLRELYLYPTAASYIAPAQIHIHAMNSLLRTSSMRDSVFKAEQLYNVSKLYWNLGYPQQAYRLARQAVRTDPAFFVGLLWTWYYGIQLGNTSKTADDLAQLEQIDRNNPIVKSFQTMTALNDSLQRSNDHQRRSDLRLALARQYSSIDLPDAVMDEAQRALGENPKNEEAWRALADFFEQKNYKLAARKVRDKAADQGIIISPASATSTAAK